MIVQTLAARAQTLALLGRMDEARDTARAAVEAIDPELPFTDVLKPRYQLLLAKCHACLGELRPALDLLDRTASTWECGQCQAEALEATWLEVRAEIRRSEGKLGEGIADLERAADLREEAAKKFMGGEEYASARTVLTLRRLMQLLDEAGRESAFTKARQRLDELCERFRYPMPPRAWE